MTALLNDLLITFNSDGEELSRCVNPDECDFDSATYNSDSYLFFPAGTSLDDVSQVCDSMSPVPALADRRIRYLSVNRESLTPIVFCVGDSLFWVNPNGLGLYTPSRCVLEADEFSVRRYLSEPNPSVRHIREYIRYRLPAILKAIQ